MQMASHPIETDLPFWWVFFFGQCVLWKNIDLGESDIYRVRAVLNKRVQTLNRKLRHSAHGLRSVLNKRVQTPRARPGLPLLV